MSEQAIYLKPGLGTLVVYCLVALIAYLASPYMLGARPRRAVRRRPTA